MKTRYTALSAEQKLALTSEDLDIAIQLEAAERGIPIPITFSDAINQIGYVGHSIPAEAVGFYEIHTGAYNGSTGVCYKTEDAALKALEGAIHIKEEGYAENRRKKIQDSDFTVRKVFLTHSKAAQFGAAVKQYEDDREPYDKLCEEVSSDLRAIRQADYDARIIAEKRAKYLALANGDEATAERFWNNLERGEWKQSPPVVAASDDLDIF